MRDPKRIDTFLEILADEWRTQPDTRFGQLIENLKTVCCKDRDFFHVEDEVVAEWILNFRKYLQEHSLRQMNRDVD